MVEIAEGGDITISRFEDLKRRSLKFAWNKKMNFCDSKSVSRGSNLRKRNFDL